MRISGPTYKVGLCVHDTITLIADDEEKADILKKAEAYKLTAKKWM